MCKLKTVLWINVVLFSLIGILHLLRLLRGWPAQIGGWDLPLWLSVIALILSGVLVYFNGKHLTVKKK